MAWPIARPVPTNAQYRPLLAASHVTGDEEPRGDFFAFISRPYSEVLGFLDRHPIFANIVLPHIQPDQFWSDDLEKRASSIRDCPQDVAHSYPHLIDVLYDRSGLAHLYDLLDRAEQARSREASTPADPAAVFTGQKARTARPSAYKLMGLFEPPDLPPWGRVDPVLTHPLTVQKDRAELKLVSALLEKIDTFPAAIQQDPLVYWVPLVKLASSVPDHSEKTATHFSVLHTLFSKARKLAVDDVMGVLFDVEFAEFTDDPMDIAMLDQKISDVRKAIAGVQLQQNYTQANGQTESGAERIGRYYSVIGHLLTRKYGVAISSMTPNPGQIAQIEALVEALLQERRDKTTVDEALVYADTVAIIASAWAAEGGLMTQRLMIEGLPAAREELTRLMTFLKRFETLCNGHYLGPDGGEQLLEKMADIRWKIYGEAHFKAGLPLQGLTNLDSEAKKFQGTKAYADHVLDLGKRYPWLVDQDGKIDLNHVGDYGEKAASVTGALFYLSRATGREIGLPIMGAVAGSLGGPLGSIAGGYAGKGLNRLINASTGDAREIISQARATGIPLISEGLSEQLSHSETINLATCGVSSLLMFRFYRSALSLTRGASQASYRFVMHGGLQKTARASLQRLSWASLRETGRSLGTRTVAGIRDIPSGLRAIPGKVVEVYGRSGIWPAVKFGWDQYGVRMRLATSGTLLAADYLPDRKFNTWAGPLGASLLINDVYGKVIWGWNANAGMVGFVWRYGFELGVQAMQGIPISRPRMDYTVAGMLASYTLRGVNKLYTLGRAETHSSPVLQRLAHFVEEYDVLVPRSVTGLARIKAAWGMVRGYVMRIGKPAKVLSADLPDGTVLRVEEVAKAGDHYTVRVVRKGTLPTGGPVEVATDGNGNGGVIEKMYDVLVPRASPLGRMLSRTVHERLSDAGVYRVPNAVMRLFGIQPKWWVKLGQRVGTPDKPIFNLRGSVANAGELPILALAGGGFGVLQDADSQMTGLYRAADYGIAFFFQHKVQHLLKIDGVVSAAAGYALGIPFSILSLPLVFPTVINQAPALTKKDKGYFDRIVAGDDDGANDALKSAITSLCPVSGLPVVGNHFWNHVTPFGAVKDSYYRIEEVGALTYWRKMLQKLDENHIMMRFIDKVARDSRRYLVDRDLPEDPVRLRLLILELAFVKRLMRDKTHPELMRHANSNAVLRGAVSRIPTIRTDSDLRQMVTGLNVDKRVGTNTSM